MKKETLEKRIKALLYTKNGKLAAKYSSLEEMLVKGKFYGVYYSGSGRFSRISDSAHRAICEALTKLRIDYTIGNDAPRGGACGTYIVLTSKGKRQVRDYIKPILEQKAAEEKQKIAMKEAYERQVATLVELLEAHPQEFNIIIGGAKGYLSRRRFGNKIHRLAKELHTINNDAFFEAVNRYNEQF